MPATSASSSGVTRKAARWRFYTWVAVGTALIVFVGFARTYYLKAFYSTPPPFNPVLSPLVHLHGLIMTTWFLFFFVQVTLVAAHRTDLHRRLGVAGAVLAGLVVAIDTEVALRNTHRNFTSNPGSPIVLGFLAVNFGILLLFGIFVTAAILLRRRPDYHKRLMALACLSILGPAIDRFPLLLPFLNFLDNFSLWQRFGLWVLCAVVCIVTDTFKNRRLHPAWVWGTLLIVGLQVVTGLVMFASAWQRLAAWLVK